MNKYCSAVELLAPAGSREAAVAAIEAGADAIYLGGKLFGARHYAPNFTDELLAEIVRYAHLRNVFVYVTVNTLVDNQEIPHLAAYLRTLHTVGVDAIIVQDLGTALIAAKVVPGLPLHASTQMTVHNLAGVEFLADHGFSRVVVARELSLSELAHICQHSPVEIETFAHGALCISYSGQCLMSSLIGGRSGNRGQCAQPCRLPYSLVDHANNQQLTSMDAGNYLLSPKDLCTLELLPQLLACGLKSLKLEGRMKRPEYVAIVVDTYRQALDRLSLDPKQYQVEPQELQDLAQSFNRGFTTAYLETKLGAAMMSDRRPNNRGVYIGRVSAYDRRRQQVTIKLETALAVGDQIDCWVKVGGRVNSPVTELIVDGTSVNNAQAGCVVTLPLATPVQINDRIFKVFAAELTARARSFFTGDGRRKQKLKAAVVAKVGEPLQLIVSDTEGIMGQATTSFIVEAARNRPLTVEVLSNQLSRLGNTPFSLDELAVDIEPNIMVPLSELNDVRRRAIEDLEQSRLALFKRAPILKPTVNLLPPIQSRVATVPLLAVNVDTVAKGLAALEGGADRIYFGGESYSHQIIRLEHYQQLVRLTRERGKQIVFTTPRITKDADIMNLQPVWSAFKDLLPDAVAVANLGTLKIVHQQLQLPVWIDFPLNIFNSAALEFYTALGSYGATLSPELTFTQLADLTSRSKLALECLVHGRLPLMVSEHCLLGSRLGTGNCADCNAACSRNRYFLTDRKDEQFPVVSDQFGRMHILNAKELSMLPHVQQFGRLSVSSIRIEGKYETETRLREIVTAYKRLLTKPELEPLTIAAELEHEHITRGHYFRGVLAR